MSSTLRKSLRVIECLSRSEHPRGISDMARELEMDKSAVQRIFQTLQSEGYLEKAPNTSRYRLTLKLWELGSPIIARHELRRHVHPILRYGAKVSGFTAFFTWADFPEIVYLDKVEGIHGRTYTAEPGQRNPVWLTAGGKAVLAQRPGDALKELADVIRDRPDLTPIDAARLKALKGELADIRQRKFAISEGGTMPGINSVAAAVWHDQPEPVGSVVLTADNAAMPADNFDSFGATVISMAEEATRALGGERHAHTALLAG